MNMLSRLTQGAGRGTPASQSCQPKLAKRTKQRTKQRQKKRRRRSRRSCKDLRGRWQNLPRPLTDSELQVRHLASCPPAPSSGDGLPSPTSQVAALTPHCRESASSRLLSQCDSTRHFKLALAIAVMQMQLQTAKERQRWKEEMAELEVENEAYFGMSDMLQDEADRHREKAESWEAECGRLKARLGAQCKRRYR